MNLIKRKENFVLSQGHETTLVHKKFTGIPTHRSEIYESLQAEA